MALGIGKAGYQYFGAKFTNLLGREVHNGQHLPAQQHGGRIVVRYLGAGLFQTDFGTKINQQLIGRPAGFRKRMHLADGTHAHINVLKFGPGKWR